MGKRRGLFLVLLVMVMSYAALFGMVGGSEDEERGGEGESGGRRPTGEDWFLLQDSKHVVQTEAGFMKVVRGFGGRFVDDKPLHIGFISMEPNSLFIPQYLDSSLILFICRGEAKVGSIYKDELVERQLRTGDVYRIDAGSAFYLVNTAEGQKLHVICSIDTSESLSWHSFQSFFIGGGRNPKSVLSGFDQQTLSTAFNVSIGELRDIMTRQQSGAIVYLSPESHPPSVWSRFMALKKPERIAHLKRIVHFEVVPRNEEEWPTWSFREFLISLFGKENKKTDDWKRTKTLDSYNLYDRRPDFRNNYGWSLAVDESDYSPLRRSGIGIYLVNLTAGSMMAPHINPTATEYGIVLKGSGNIQIVYPNGSLAMNAKVSEGDVFWVPRYFPFCQIASRTGPFEFFGFTTSAHRNRPQFLVGANSLLQTMRGPELAAAFGVDEERLRDIIDAQREGIILPSASASPPDETVHMEEQIRREVIIPKMVDSFGNDMVMGFD
ncbi:hypothetical protein RJ639_031315 [Escallonia herrerae]|uniref:Cupin type-1 domain-containing protein n=1 Tax=Escallonia herrerae TaxID=1293975 RepID=A0AA88WYW0_9ASTE|nr:hypothetical protein RJ639_031315 [Escallonia herrerae]